MRHDEVIVLLVLQLLVSRGCGVGCAWAGGLAGTLVVVSVRARRS